jgi:DNA helicase-2/ATP-dependent DNA helicase PcrA
MTIKKHPDFTKEVNHLEETKHYIEDVIDASEKHMDDYKSNIQQAYEELDYLDSSQSYINILTNSKFLEITERDFHLLKRNRDKPYFCRVDFKPESSSEAEPLYIGKTALYRREDQQPIIVDWRSPIANVYYEGRIGPVSYKTAKGTATGELFLKRQYTIENGALANFQDIDITARDELLQQSLGSSKDNRLKDIVSTIQAEQNRIIRADMSRPLIVQGVAGSGKTTIALHRIAYFIYTYADRFDPDEFIIIAPNRLFINYISEVLPELGVEEVKQTTFNDFAAELIGKKYKLEPDTKLQQFINGNDKELELLKWQSSFKGSMAFKAIVDRYIQDVTKRFLITEDFTFGDYVLYKKEDIHQLLSVDYAYLPIFKRVESIKKILSNHLKTKKKEILAQMEESYDDQIDHAFDTMTDLAKRKIRVVKLMDEKEERLQQLAKDSRTLVKSYMDTFPKGNLLDYYRELMCDEQLFQSYAQGQLSGKQIDYIVDYSRGLLEQNKVEVEDLAALLYLQHHFFGMKDKVKIKTIVIDEAQDFSVFQLYSLKTLLNTELFTILGDLSQGIHSYRGITDWKQVYEEVFPNGNCQYLTLKQSYRTTIEIMDLANQIIQQSQGDGIVLAEPLVRHGPKPSWIEVQEDSQAQEWISDLLSQADKLKQEGFQSIAIIGKSMEECKNIKKLLGKKTQLSISLLTGEENMDNIDIAIVPSYIAKGLEFDAVFIVAIDDTFTQQEMDIKLLYVAMTRPLHRLIIYSKKGSISSLQAADPTLYEKC